MSVERARAAINGEMTDRIPQWDVPDCPALAQQLFDYDVKANPHRACIDMLKHFDIDVTISSIPDDCAEWNFPLVRYYEDATFTDDPENARYGSLPRAPSPRPYTSMYDALGMKAHGAFWGFSPTLTMQNHPCSDPEDVLKFEPLEYSIFCSSRSRMIKAQASTTEPARSSSRQMAEAAEQPAEPLSKPRRRMLSFRAQRFTTTPS